VSHLPPTIAALAAPPPPATPASAAAQDGEQAPLIDALTRHRGNVAAVARELGKHREQIHRWLRRAGIDPERFKM
jgi:transcriptional regulator of acetoin/glycerol metabolism